MKKDHIEGLDYVRAVMSVCVVCWHMRVVGISDIFYKNAYLAHHFGLTDFLNFHVFLLSVPAFLLMSNYLYAAGGGGGPLLLRRVSRIAILLTFWATAYLTVSHGFVGAIEVLQASDRSLLVIILRAGMTIYYFFVSLIICYFVSFLAAKASKNIQLALLALSVVFLESAPYIADATGALFLCSYWCPTNFIPYAFAAVVIASHKDVIDNNRGATFLASLLLTVVLAAWEWSYSVGDVIFLAEKQGLPSYTRGSLVLGAIAVLVLATDSRIRSGRLIKFMSANSLALYCIHPFFVDTIRNAVVSAMGPMAASLYVAAALVILSSYLAVVVLRVYLKREVIE